MRRLAALLVAAVLLTAGGVPPELFPRLEQGGVVVSSYGLLPAAG
jgi:hypothetical protein